MLYRKKLVLLAVSAALVMMGAVFFIAVTGGDAVDHRRGESVPQSPTGVNALEAGGSLSGGSGPGRAIEVEPWVRDLSEILTSSSSPSDALRGLVQSVHSASPAAQAVIARHMVNLTVSAADYQTVLPLFENRQLSAQFHKRMAQEFLNAPDAIKYPTLLKLASSDWHPYREKALHHLQTLTGFDAGNDWGEWERIIQRRVMVEQKVQ
jgi:hypothetical protein